MRRSRWGGQSRPRLGLANPPCHDPVRPNRVRTPLSAGRVSGHLPSGCRGLCGGAVRAPDFPKPGRIPFMPGSAIREDRIFPGASSVVPKDGARKNKCSTIGYYNKISQSRRLGTYGSRNIYLTRGRGWCYLECHSEKTGCPKPTSTAAESLSEKMRDDRVVAKIWVSSVNDGARSFALGRSSILSSRFWGLIESRPGIPSACRPTGNGARTPRSASRPCPAFEPTQNLGRSEIEGIPGQACHPSCRTVPVWEEEPGFAGFWTRVDACRHLIESSVPSGFMSASRDRPVGSPIDRICMIGGVVSFRQFRNGPLGAPRGTGPPARAEGLADFQPRTPARRLLDGPGCQGGSLDRPATSGGSGA